MALFDLKSIASITITRNRIILTAIIATFSFGLIFLIFFGARIFVRDPQVQLTVWGVFDGRDIFVNTLINAYQKKHPNVKVSYVQKTYLLNEAQNYEKDLIDALAADAGPDIFMVHNTWIPKHHDKIGQFGPKLQATINFPFVNFRDAFPKVVGEDFTRDTTIYGSPLFLDSLAMFYNRDIFDRKGIALVPKTWLELERLVSQLREINPATNEIQKAAVAIGGSETSINRATDLLSAMMLQRGVEFTDQSNTRASFAHGTGLVYPGLEALKFYTQFANPLSPLFTWSERFPYSIDSFASGNTAIMFNYAHEIPSLKSKNPFLDFLVAPLPQLASVTPTKYSTYANYWGLTVSKQSQYPTWAWDFVLSVTTDESIIGPYLEKTRKPPALLTLIDKKRNDPVLGIFARQALTAGSWWQQDNFAIDDIFSNMIREVIRGELSAESAIVKAENDVSLLMR